MLGWSRAANVQSFSTRSVLEHADPSNWREHHFGLPLPRWKDLAGRAFWVTGAGTGYGRAISLALGAAGAKVVLTGRREKMLRQTLQEGASMGIVMDACVAVEADISDPSDIDRAIETLGRQVPCLDGLVNCAALPQPDCGPFPLTSQSLPEWIGLMKTNVTAQWLASRACLPLMVKAARIRILFLSSEAGWASTPGFGPYNISKAALNSLGSSFAAECAAKYPSCDVQVNVLVPGEARTEMNRGSNISPFAAASMVLALLSHPSGGPNGRLFHRDGRHLAFACAEPYPKDLFAP